MPRLSAFERAAPPHDGRGGALQVGRYSAEERRQRISRDRQKRNERNFKKKIKVGASTVL